MERTKEILAIAPFAAILIAISYLQGYWGKFEILAFPYLSFQELIAYSTAPFFGFAISTIGGMLFGALSAFADGGKPTSKWQSIFERTFLMALIGVLIYLRWPEKWLFLPIPFVFAAVFIIRAKAFSSIIQRYTHLILPIICTTFLLIGSYGYGRAQAERLIIDPKRNVTLSLETGEESGKLIGKLGNYYFFLDSFSRVNIFPEVAIKRIQYKRVHHLDQPRFRPLAAES